MSGNVDVAIGVVNGKVVAQWHQPVREITFDPQNAYRIGMAMSRAAMEAHRGTAATGDTQFLAGELAQVKVKVSEQKRELLIGMVATIVKSLLEKQSTPGYIAMHAVDTVLQETAR